MTCRTLVKDYPEYRRLEAVAKLLEVFSKNGYKYRVDDCYLDYGSGWMWTTIIRGGEHGCQVLDPVEWEAIMAAQTATDLIKVVEGIRNDQYFND